ncbi:HAD hydrolase family protein [Lichenihabitans psoromatis]|uniref:HAD hydrolase family protein n=1 Tax=Lichenihabitans psoromatis TaxID=2528642 RepID=UPI001FE219CE|nr:HAD hydrolase family protein [Lichenihabitans psoromatis]
MHERKSSRWESDRMAYFLALATDYDGTIAHDGVLDGATVTALETLKQAGRRLIMVTGRELPDLERVCPRLDLFDRVVAENGALLYTPATKDKRPLGPPPPPEFVERLRSLSIQPLSVGEVIVATWEPNEGAVLEAIRDLGLDLQIIFNKGAVMVLPSGINKASGLGAALEDLGLSAHNVVATGDAENDLAFMRTCGCAVAVGNALPAVKDAADVVTAAARGAGVAEVIATWLSDEAALIDAAILRHSVRIGETPGDKRDILLRPDRGSVLITGTSGGGKSTLATALLEHLSDAGFQLCLFDPEGDYGQFGDVVTFGDAKTVVTPEPVLDAVRKLGNNVCVNLLASSVEDRPQIFASLFPPVLDIHAKYGRPHWVLVDEAHHMLPRTEDAGDGLNLREHIPAIFVTVHPDTLAKQVLRNIGIVLCIGRDSAGLIDSLSKVLGRPCPPMPDRTPDRGEAYYWECRTDNPPLLVRVDQPRNAMKRHTRKYAEGTLGEDRSFFFRGQHAALNLRAQNLMLFLQIGEGVDEETYRHHLQHADFSTWMRSSIKDGDLADEVAGIEAHEGIAIPEARKLIRTAIEQRYTAPAEPAG